MKPPTSSQATDVLMGDEEQNRKQKEELKGRNRELVLNPAILNHSVASYDVQGSYGEPILFTPSAQKGVYIYIFFFLRLSGPMSDL